MLVEKPFTLKVSEAEDLIDDAKQFDRVLMVGHVYLYHPVVVELKRRIDSGQLGRIYYIYSVRTGLGPIRSDVNAMWDLAPHDISIGTYLLDALPESVSAIGSSYLRKGVHDIVFLVIRFAGGILSQVHTSWLDPYKTRRLTIVGAERMVVFDDVDVFGKLKIFEKAITKSERAGDSFKFLLNVSDGDVIIPKIDAVEPLKNLCQEFIKCVRENRSPIASGENALQTLKVLEAAQKSLDGRGEPVPIDQS